MYFLLLNIVDFIIQFANENVLLNYNWFCIPFVWKTAEIKNNSIENKCILGLCVCMYIYKIYFKAIVYM